ncbi:MAG: methylated-DNA--[protein]-cysteine S-methyltransferase [Bacillota bacterium]|nr:methylated-DNA--[protein]-cysteine S-methyltransferase [Bacillota bacterium]
MKYIFFYQTRIGRIGIVETDAAITNVYFPNEIIPTGMDEKETELIKKAGEEINEYFSGKRSNFDIPLAPAGTEFQKSVWNVLKKIPYGKTFSYKQVAEAIGNPKASRAVGMANNRNPIPLFIPCHRVIGSNGKLVGFAGGLDLKESLLNMEKENAG